jgi:hypothetical protein
MSGPGIVVMIAMFMAVMARIMILVIVSLTMINVCLFREIVPGTTFAFGAFCEVRQEEFIGNSSAFAMVLVGWVYYIL